MKDHVKSAHMPSLFVQLDPEDRALGNTHRQRLNGLSQLARSLLGPNATPHTLMNHVNSRLQDIIHAWANIWVPLQFDMKALCKFARWQIPEKFPASQLSSVFGIFENLCLFAVSAAHKSTLQQVWYIGESLLFCWVSYPTVLKKNSSKPIIRGKARAAPLCITDSRKISA